MNTLSWTLVLTTIVGSALVGLVAIVGGFLHYRRERLLAHAERMKALELGRELPDDAATARIKAVFRGTSAGGSDDSEDFSPARKCYSTALWVAFWGFLFASQVDVHGAHAVAIAIAASVGAVGVTAMICGTILASRVSVPRSPVASKGPTDPDAFDLVGRRG